ncbi:3-methyl-2-oxobutanoate hydroxymethyltransferase [Thermosulfuriphilus sp.]
METSLTVKDIRQRKGQDKIVALTAYDALMAKLVDEAGCDLVLVGDSLGMLVLGYENTLPVTMDEMIHHARAVRRGIRRALLVGDMPFLSYQVGKEEAIRNAGRFVKEAGCAAVKIEGVQEMAEIVAAVVRAGIPVLGHIGLTPQTAQSLGGFKVQGRDEEGALRIIEDARTLEEVGVFALILECIPAPLSALITQMVSIPTIGIGAGPFVDGQILVLHDLLGLFEGFRPRFAKAYANLAQKARQALSAYVAEVRSGAFPDKDHSFGMHPEILEKIKKRASS